MPLRVEQIVAKLRGGEVDFTVHAVFEAAADLIFVDEIERALPSGQVIENDSARLRCLVRCELPSKACFHVVFDYADWEADPAAHLVIVTVYRPEPDGWIDGRFRKT